MKNKLKLEFKEVDKEEDEKKKKTIVCDGLHCH
jgi:hypothetical protein